MSCLNFLSCSENNLNSNNNNNLINENENIAIRTNSDFSIKTNNFLLNGLQLLKSTNLLCDVTLIAQSKLHNNNQKNKIT
jgi:hypothetical protein